MTIKPRIEQVFRTSDGENHLTMDAAVAHQLDCEVAAAEICTLDDFTDSLATNTAFRNKIKNILKWLD